MNGAGQGPSTRAEPGAELGAEPGAEISAEINADQPWPGLLPFTEAARDFFHGRDDEAAELLRLVKRATLTVLFGQSGLGKSSLLRAGVFPKLRLEGHLPVYIRLQLRADAPTLLEQTYTAIQAECAAHRVECPVPRPGGSLWEYFHARDGDFWSARNRLLIPVLVFDQFEEVFTLGAGLDAGDQRRARFVQELADLVEHRIPVALAAAGDGEAALPAALDVSRDTFRVVFAFREDYLAEFEDLRQQMPAIMRNRLRLSRMKPTQALAAIQQSGGRLVDTPVAEQIIRFVSAQRADPRRGEAAAAATEVEPALLSVVCRELNNRRLALGQATISAQMLQGSAQQQIIAEYYENSFAGIDPALRALVEDQLLTEGGFRDSFAYEDALRQQGVQRAQVERLIDRRLLRVEERAGVQRLELTHDLLTEVAQQSRDRRQQAREARQRQDREDLKRRRVRRLVAAGAVASVVGAGLIVTFAVLLRQSDTERQRLKQTQSVVLLDRANSLFEQGVPGLPQSLLAQALVLDPEHRAAAARALAYLRQRNFPALLAESPPESVALEKLVDVRWHDPASVTLVHAGGVQRWPVPAQAAVAAATAASAAGAAVVTAPPAAPPAALPAAPPAALELPSPAAAGSWAVVDEPGAAAREQQVWIEAGRELRSASRQPGAAAVGVAVDQPQWPLVVSRDARRVMLRSGAGRVLVFSLTAGLAPQALHVIDAAQGSLRLGPGGRRLVALAGATVTTYDMDRDQLHRLQHPSTVNTLALSPAGAVLATGSQDRQVRLWDMVGGTLLSPPMRHEGAVLSLDFSADGRRLLSGSLDGTARLWSVPSGRALAEPLLAGSPVRWTRFAPEGSRALLYDADRRIGVWRLSAPTPAALSTPLPGAVSALAFDATRGLLAVAAADGSLSLWQVEVGPVLRLRWRRSGVGTVAALALGPGDVLAAARARNQVQLLDLASGQDLGDALAHEGPVSSLRFSRDGRHLATGSDDGAARVFEVATRRRLGFPIAPQRDAVIHAELSSDGRQLITASLNQGVTTVWLWSMAQRTPRRVDAGEHFALATFAGDGRLITVLGRKAQRWKLPAAGDETAPLKPEGAPLTLRHLIWSAALSPDGRLLALGGLNGVTRTVDTAQWKAIGEPMNSSGEVASVAFTADGRWLLTRDASGSARLWDSRSGAAVTDPLASAGPLLAAHVDASGAHAFTVADTGMLSLQRLDLDFALPVPAGLAPLLTAAGGAALDENGNITWARDREDQLARIQNNQTPTSPWWSTRLQEITDRLRAAGRSAVAVR